MASWNSFLWPLVIIRSPEFMTLPARPGQPARAVHDGVERRDGRFRVSVLPILVLYLFAQRYVVHSVASSGLK